MNDTDAIRIGLVITMIAGALTGPFAAICTQMKRIEGTYSPLSYTELGMGMLGVLLFIFPTLVMQVCAFRPAETDPDLLLSLNDLAWIPFVGIFAPAVIQNIAIGIAAFKDAEGRVFPRWLGYFNFWAALAFAGGAPLLLQDRSVRLGRRLRVLGSADDLRCLVLRHVLRDEEGDQEPGDRGGRRRKPAAAAKPEAVPA